ncbi:LysR substrate-binding domain-containing protein [Parasphingopyxis lamellibrachiae]|uniref:LysR family glycine cleavage system transcriptional activator n=1 Tax=Parasphingopyxis lamellibrachiae TaxID=680125 RepID=A0A3D9FFI1_9SPHN|nr:LysR substrate-binding domain-containing protein [Parasphingopyxis lamellibrachiae]RED16549.1 LysR family glycine cleavage system transcriptional activator [Parasphingopyxis lamellibrachiae]
MRRLPPLTAIEAFVQVARLGSVKAAAEELSLSSPALSRRVQNLEHFLGRALFERRHHAMVLTEDGEALLARVSAPLNDLANAIEVSTGQADLVRLKLGVLPLFASQRLIGKLPELRQMHPELHIDIDTAAHGTARLGDGLDAAITLAQSIDPGLYSRKIDHNIITPIAARGLALRGAPVVEPEQIAGLTILLHRDMPETFHFWRNAIGYPNLEPAAEDHFDSGQLMLDAAAQGLGVAFMLDSHLHDASDDRLGSLFDTAVESPYSYWFSCRRSALRRKPIRQFHDWLFSRVCRQASGQPPASEAIAVTA